MTLNLTGLKKAMVSLEEAIDLSHNLPAGLGFDMVRDSVIQRFKYTYELSWKLLQRWVQQNINPEDAEPRTKKNLFRLAAKKKMIDDPKHWFEFSEARNQVAHTYNEKNANYVYEVALAFLSSVQLLYKELSAHND